MIASSRQHVSFSISVESQDIYMSAIYAASNYVIRRQLWTELNSLQNVHKAPWCFIGDFNSVLGSHEHRGRCLPSSLSCTEFRNWTDLNNLIHISTRGS